MNLKHDLGLVISYILLQALFMEIITDRMAGFNKEKMIEALQLTQHQNPLCIIALGYLNDAEKLEEHFKAREFTARTRRLLAEMVKEL